MMRDNSWKHRDLPVERDAAWGGHHVSQAGVTVIRRGIRSTGKLATDPDPEESRIGRGG
jgi:hypothetical protein